MNTFSKFIVDFIPEPLSSVHNHLPFASIERFIAKGSPVHLALHKVCKIKETPEAYTTLHKHEEPEINVIIGEKDQMEYLIQIGEQKFIVSSPSSIWIPAGVEHSANLIKGSGYFLCLIFSGNGIGAFFKRAIFDGN